MHILWNAAIETSRMHLCFCNDTRRHVAPQRFFSVLPPLKVPARGLWGHLAPLFRRFSVHSCRLCFYEKLGKKGKNIFLPLNFFYIER